MDDQKKEDKRIQLKKRKKFTSSEDEFQHSKAFLFFKLRFFSSFPQV
jgi:hypothetical protein